MKVTFTGVMNVTLISVDHVSTKLKELLEKLGILLYIRVLLNSTEIKVILEIAGGCVLQLAQNYKI